MKMQQNIKFLFSVLLAFVCLKSFSQPALPKISTHDSLIIAMMQHTNMSSSFSFSKNPNNIRPLKSTQNITLKINGFRAPFAGAVSCADTSLSLSYTSGIDSLTLIVYEMASARNGDYIVVGSYSDFRNNQADFCSFIMRIDSAFQPIWIKKYNSIAPLTGYWYKVKELNDNSILVGGNFYTDGYSMYGINVARVANNGELIWNKTFFPRTWVTSPGYAFIDVNQIMQDQDNSIYISCREKIPNFSPNNGLLVKLDVNGNILWDRNPIEGYQSTGYGGSVIRNDKVIAFGRNMAWSASTGYTYGTTGIYVFDKTNGNLVQQKSYNPINNPTGELLWGHVTELTEMNNGDVSITGTLLGQFGTSLKATVALQFKTTDLSFVKGSVYNTVYPPALYRTKLKVFPDGNSFFSYSNYTNPYTHDDFFVQSYNDGIIRQRSKLAISSGTDYKTTVLQKNTDSYVFMHHKYDSANNYLRSNELFKLNISDSNSACLGTDANACSIDQVYVQDAETYFIDSGRNVLLDTAFGTLIVSDITIQIQQNCTQVIKCDSLKIISNVDTVCNTANPVLVTAIRNKNCRTLINWNSNSPLVQSIQPISDSTALVWLNNGPGECYILGSFNSTCGVLSDSIKLTKSRSAQSLDIGPDLKICGNSSFLLNAHRGFKNYLWQNNSTDSVFLVNIPGNYYVTITDYCNTAFSDTIIAIAGQPDLIDIGIDTSICSKDTLMLSAPVGFMSYTWSPNYKISDITAQSVKVYPDVTTKYHLAAQKTPGCISTDSIEISVYTLPANFIFHDTLICQRENTILKPTGSFKNYLWSTGSKSDKININSPGIYWLQVKDNNGCTAKEFINVSSKPCLTIVHFPNSFTPNADGKNDIFKAGVYGVLKQYNLIVYNRYGQKVFETADPGSGWDGLFRSKKQNQDTYTWIANYQLEGKLPEQQTGTVTLIR